MVNGGTWLIFNISGTKKGELKIILWYYFDTQSNFVTVKTQGKMINISLVLFSNSDV